MLGLLLAALLSLPAAAQEGHFRSACFHGLDDTNSPAVLDPCDSQDSLNTESSLSGNALLKRKGYALAATLTYSTSAITGAHSFINGSGSKVDIVCHDRLCSSSINGSAFTIFHTTAAIGVKRWSWVSLGGIAYGANDKYDPIIKYNGSSTSSPVGMPLGSILELTQSRLAVGDISGNPNRIYYSSAGAVENFTLGVNSEDPYFDDLGSAGDKVTGLKYHAGMFYVFKTKSITACELANQYTSYCAPISQTVGTQDPASIVSAGSALYFKASDKSYWEIDRGLRPISNKISNLIKSQNQGSDRANTQTSKTDWDAGVQFTTGAWNTSVISGSILPSSATFVDTISADFSSGTLGGVSLSTGGNAISLSSSVFEDSFGYGNYTTNPVWTPQNLDWDVNAGTLRFLNGSGLARISVPQSISTGSFKASLRGISGGVIEAKFISLGSDFLLSNGYALSVTPNSPTTINLSLVKYPGATALVTVNNNPVADSEAAIPYTIYRTAAGVFTVYVTSAGADNLILTATDTSYSSSTHMVLRADTQGMYYDDFYFYTYSGAGGAGGAGQIHSRIFDTQFSTVSLAGPFTVSTNIPNGTTLTYQIRGGNTASVDGTWKAFASINNGARNTLQTRYFQYQSSFTTTIATVSPSIQDVTLIEATTGLYRTSCLQIGVSTPTWGIMSCAETKSGMGSLVYYATSSIKGCSDLPATDPMFWNTSITNNATLAIATGTAVYIGIRSLLGSATDQAQVDACTLYWTDGTGSQPTWGAFDPIKNAVYWNTTINNGLYSNRLLKYDRNLNSWHPFSITASPMMFGSSLYLGGASSATWNLYGGNDSDNGTAIGAWFKTKDAGAESPFIEKGWDRASVLTRNQGSGTLTVTWALSTGKTGNYSVSLATTAGSNYRRSNYLLPSASPAPFVNFKFSNYNANEPFEVLGLDARYLSGSTPWRVSEGP